VFTRNSSVHLERNEHVPVPLLAPVVYLF